MDGDAGHGRRAVWKPMIGRDDGSRKKGEKWQVWGITSHSGCAETLRGSAP